jgi:hypothetical protein|tara:strand:- start:25 stop:315 length:291 start_codon:yes stop_codon:yes gene_type:complete
MPAGGKMPGAGRPRGVKIGTKAERLDKMLGKGTKTPLQYMMNILNDKKTSPEKKMWAAERAAPYVHSRLSSISNTISGDDDKPLSVTIGWRKKSRD